jgi:DNA oxidative demethylase
MQSTSLPQTMELFQPDEALVPTVPGSESLAPGAMLLRGRTAPDTVALLADLQAVLEQAPFRHMVTPGGSRMSVAMSNCGALGWVSDPTGYRYDSLDPDSGRHWPAMPASFLRLARQTAAEAGFSSFEPDACLMNCYEPGARLTLHQDRNERDFRQPIVSVSLGLPAVFLFGGPRRGDRPTRVPLTHGDVVVWGGASRQGQIKAASVAKSGVACQPGTAICAFRLLYRCSRISRSKASRWLRSKGRPW